MQETQSTLCSIKCKYRGNSSLLLGWGTSMLDTSKGFPRCHEIFSSYWREHPMTWGMSTSCLAASSRLLLLLSTAHKVQMNGPRQAGNKHLQQYDLHPHCSRVNMLCILIAAELQKNVVCRGLLEVTGSNCLSEADLARSGTSAIGHLSYFGGPPYQQQCHTVPHVADLRQC